MSKQKIGHYVGDNLYQIEEQIAEHMDRGLEVVTMTSLFKPTGTYRCEAIVVYKKKEESE